MKNLKTKLGVAGASLTSFGLMAQEAAPEAVDFASKITEMETTVTGITAGVTVIVFAVLFAKKGLTIVKRFVASV